MAALQENWKMVALNLDMGVWGIIKDIAHKEGKAAAEFGRLFMKKGLEDYLAKKENQEEQAA